MPGHYAIMFELEWNQGDAINNGQIPTQLWVGVTKRTSSLLFYFSFTES